MAQRNGAGDPAHLGAELLKVARRIRKIAKQDSNYDHPDRERNADHKQQSPAGWGTPQDATKRSAGPVGCFDRRYPNCCCGHGVRKFLFGELWVDRRRILACAQSPVARTSGSNHRGQTGNGG